MGRGRSVHGCAVPAAPTGSTGQPAEPVPPALSQAGPAAGERRDRRGRFRLARTGMRLSVRAPPSSVWSLARTVPGLTRECGTVGADVSGPAPSRSGGSAPTVPVPPPSVCDCRRGPIRPIGSGQSAVSSEQALDRRDARPETWRQWRPVPRRLRRPRDHEPAPCPTPWRARLRAERLVLEHRRLSG
jgi:hypothetical protein